MFKKHIIKFFFNTLVPSLQRYFATDIDARPMIRTIKTLHKNNLIGVEIGVMKGYNSYNIIKLLSIKHLYLVDPYFQGYTDGIRKLDYSSCEIIARKLLKPFKNKITFIKKDSSSAIDDIPDNLDFVYIDGNHQMEFVLKDCELYFPKIKKGGFLGGHDFYAGISTGVPNAVFTFVKKYNLSLNGSKDDWWIVKGDE